MNPQAMAPQDIQSPTSPLGNFPELAGMYRSSFQLPLSNAQTGAQSAKDQVTLANQAAATKAAQAKAAFLADPKNYQQVQRADGGYGFYDPSGKEISASQYAAVTGKSPTEVLKNSTNPIDIGYKKDFQDLQDYINNKLISNTNAQAKLKASDVEKQVQKTYGVDISKFTPDQLIQQFQHAYPTVHGLTNVGVPQGQVFIPPASF